MTLGLIAAQMRTRDVASETTIHKWKVFSALTQARERLGLPDRALAVLSALLSFHQETTMTAGDPLVVFPSNEKLSARAHGVAPATLRRHLAILVEAGIIIRRDSPNGKRYARRGQGGELHEAFGFDLTPLVARAQEFLALAEEVTADKRAARVAREQVTLARRDITKLIALGLEDGIPGDWAGLHMAYLVIVGRLRRSLDTPALRAVAAELAELAQAIAKHLELFANMSDSSANESHSERHKQNSKSEPLESEPALQQAWGETVDVPSSGAGMAKPVKELERETGTPLGMVLQACPDIAEYVISETGQTAVGPRPIATWSVFLKTAALVRTMLGISPDAWRDAVETMGVVDASIVVAAILQKGDEIRFPGGYLRALTEKKRAGHFSTGPILMALINAGLKQGKRSPVS